MPLSETKKEYLKRRLSLYLKAEEMILNGQSYRIGSRSLTRADLSTVQSEIRRLETAIENAVVRKNSNQNRG
jgi:hypothetical protein